MYVTITRLAVVLALCALAACTATRDISINQADGDADGDVDVEDRTEELCAPTGRSLFRTGVYIAPEACTEVTLYALEESAENDAWVLAVGWPMYGEHHVLELTNETSGDTERELLYLGDPEFVLYVGRYNLGGFEMVEGDNVIAFEVYDTIEDPPGEFFRDIVREGTFTIHVTISDLRGE